MVDDTHRGPARPTPAQVERALARIDGVNGAAGHRLDDPELRAMLRSVVLGEITPDEYRERGISHLRRRSDR